MNAPHPNLASFKDLDAFRWTGSVETIDPQLFKLNTVIEKALAAQKVAARGRLFDSHEGRELVNALFELTGCDDLYDLEGDILHELRLDRDGNELDEQGERK